MMYVGGPRGSSLFSVASSHHSRVGRCDLNGGKGTTCELALGGEPDEKHGFGLVIRGQGTALAGNGS